MTPVAVPDARPVRARDEVELAAQQLQAVEAWHAERRRRERDLHDGARTREQRLDAARGLEVLRREHEALVARADAQLRASGLPLARTVACRLLVVHRNRWFVEAVSRVVGQHEVVVVAAVDNGADGVGALVAEQPDLLLIEDTLPMVSGEEVVREARRFAPTAAILVQVQDGSRAGRFLDAGATTVLARRVPPAEVAEELVRLSR